MTDLKHRLTRKAKDLMFASVHGNRLIYNTCWEDPRIDRELFQLRSDSKVVVITSAGCNALDYLLDGPAEVHAVDVNFRQNALLQLKLALFERGDHDDLFAVFGDGTHGQFPKLLASLNGRLQPPSREFWTAKQHYFDGRPIKKSFYYHGSSGDVAWMVRAFLLQPNRRLRDSVEDLLDAGSFAEQETLYRRLEPLFWNRFSRWMMRQPMVLAMLGVPAAQARLIEAHHPDGVAGYVRDKLFHVATRVPMRDNYFWRVYVRGSYTPSCCPNYLKPGNFAALRAALPRIQTHTNTLAEFLKKHPGPYSHFALLDHQDWLAEHDTAALEEEWRLLLRSSQRGTRLLLRSAGPALDFLPDWVRAAVRFDTARTEALHPQDRVGTYASLHLAVVI
jgi:S-adenosylmethionine-diacylglycerol 3-amino-3-carboxypropyl transferase